MTIRTLRAANIAFVAAIFVHGWDHFRQGTGQLSSEVILGGTVLALVAFAGLAMTLSGHPRAPLFAGAGLVLGYVGLMLTRRQASALPA